MMVHWTMTNTTNLWWWQSPRHWPRILGDCSHHFGLGSSSCFGSRCGCILRNLCGSGHFHHRTWPSRSSSSSSSLILLRRTTRLVGLAQGKGSSLCLDFFQCLGWTAGFLVRSSWVAIRHDDNEDSIEGGYVGSCGRFGWVVAIGDDDDVLG